MQLEKKIYALLKPHADTRRASFSVNYLNTEYKIMGCNMPSIRSTSAAVIKELESTMTHAEIRKALTDLWMVTDNFDVAMTPLIYFQKRKGQNDLSDWRVLKNWSKRIDNWAHSDMLSDVLSDLLERFPAEIYPMMKRWNVAKLPWQRRLSLTNLLYYSQLRKLRPLPASKILPLIKARMFDNHFYVQRAVGWTLRECHNLYPEKTETFVTKHVTDLSSFAFSAATEKYSKAKKTQLKKVRTLARKKR